MQSDMVVPPFAPYRHLAYYWNTIYSHYACIWMAGSVTRRYKHHENIICHFDRFFNLKSETATWTPDPNKTEKQNQKASERFAMDFEDRIK